LACCYVMSDTTATILAAIIAVIVSVAASWATARIALRSKLNELRQTQLSDIVRERIRTYPSLWKLCQEEISIPLFGLKTVETGWETNLANKLEEWHTGNGAFLSGQTYQGLYRLRSLARFLAAQDSVAGEDARKRLEDLEGIWTYEYYDFRGNKQNALSYQLRNDLGSYQRAALSTVPPTPPPRHSAEAARSIRRKG
jgi:hypothetical protein